MTDFLKEHLNVWWLRPESALWDAVASEAQRRVSLPSPSLDFGCGNGLYSFIAAGGAFDPDYDWFRHAETGGFARGRDIYDVPSRVDAGRHVARRPRRGFDFGFDHKANLLSQAARLGFYRELRRGDGNARLPFPDGSLRSVYCNMLYWLDDPASRFRELGRIVAPGGRVVLALQDPSFKRTCESYQWRARKSELLRMLNRGRAETHCWTATASQIKAFGRPAGLRLVDRVGYLCAPVLRFWDVGLRPLSPPLIEMARRLRPRDRRAVKALWMESALPPLRELLEVERRWSGPFGYHLAVLERT